LLAMPASDLVSYAENLKPPGAESSYSRGAPDRWAGTLALPPLQGDRRQATPERHLEEDRWEQERLRRMGERESKLRASDPALIPPPPPPDSPPVPARP